jgi:hypothetical protein
VVSLGLWLFSVVLSVHAAPGYEWRMNMEIDGMPMPMPGRTVCTPKDSKEPPVAAGDDKCRILSKKQVGNRFIWKSECKDGTMEGDITHTPTSYHGTMSMRDKSGETTRMKMRGERLGPCDYQDHSKQIAALQKQTEDQMAGVCKDALEAMQGGIIVERNACAKEKPAFCKRLATTEGFAKATRHLSPDQLDKADSGMPYILKHCGLQQQSLIGKLCSSAVGEGNFDFVGKFCPQDKPKLCGKAVSANRLGFVSANCPAEKAALIAQHCEGRRDSSQIAEKYRAFCVGALGEDIGDSTRASGNTNSSAPAGTGKSELDGMGIPGNVQEGFKNLKGLFGF